MKNSKVIKNLIERLMAIINQNGGRIQENDMDSLAYLFRQYEFELFAEEKANE